jgi:DNA-binding Xre family transcriptional regulator
VGNWYLDARAIRVGMNKRGLVSELDLVRTLLRDGTQVSPSTVHALLTKDRYDPRTSLVQAICRALGMDFKAPVDTEGKPDVPRIEAAMRRHSLGVLDLWREMVSTGYEGSFSSVRHMLDGRTESPRVSTMASLCEALALPFVAPVRR